MEVVASMDEDMPLVKFSPLPMENCFHPLSNMDGVYNILRIFVVVTPLILSLPLAQTR